MFQVSGSVESSYTVQTQSVYVCALRLAHMRANCSGVLLYVDVQTEIMQGDLGTLLFRLVPMWQENPVTPDGIQPMLLYLLVRLLP
jgi:hypothetical protein